MNIFENKINVFKDTIDSHLIDIYKTGPESLKQPINHTLSEMSAYHGMICKHQLIAITAKVLHFF